MATHVFPAHNHFMSLKPLANVSQKSFRHFLLIAEITFAPIKAIVHMLLLKDNLISEHTYVSHGTGIMSPCHSWEKLAKRGFNFNFSFWKLLSWTFSIHLGCSPSSWLLLVFGAVCFPREPWSLIGLGNHFKCASLFRLSSRLELLQGSSDMMCICSASEWSIQVILPLWNSP